MYLPNDEVTITLTGAHGRVVDVHEARGTVVAVQVKTTDGEVRWWHPIHVWAAESTVSWAARNGIRN